MPGLGLLVNLDSTDIFRGMGATTLEWSQVKRKNSAKISSIYSRLILFGTQISPKFHHPMAWLAPNLGKKCIQSNPEHKNE